MTCIFGIGVAVYSQFHSEDGDSGFIKISKDDYFEQIINNCNYVKGIKVKK